MSTGTPERYTYRLPRFRDRKDHSSSSIGSRDVASVDSSRLVDPLEPYDPPLPRKKLVSSWDSGPLLVANMNNRQSTGYELPGEGKITRTVDEGSRVWRHNTRRTYQEDVKKEKAVGMTSPTYSDSNNTFTKRRPLGEKLYYMQPRTDDDKLVSTGVPGVSTDTYVKKNSTTATTTRSPSPKRLSSRRQQELEYRANREAVLDNRPPFSTRVVVHMEDKSIQCNLKKDRDKSSRSSSSAVVASPKDVTVTRDKKVIKDKDFEISQDFKVIKSQEDGSVSAFSDVSALEDPAKKRDAKVVYSEVETHTPTETILTREFHELKKDRNTVLLENAAPRSGVNRTVEVTRSRPVSRDSYSPSPTRTRVVTKSYGVNVGSNKFGPDVTPRGSPMMKRTTPKPPPINHWYYDQGERNRMEVESPSRARNLAQETIEETISISNASSDEMIENHRDAHVRAVRSAIPSDGKVDMNANYKQIGGGSGSPPSQQHRNTSSHSLLHKRETSDIGVDAHSSRNSTNSSPALTGGPPGMWLKSIDTDYRKNMARNSDVRDNSLRDNDDHFCSATLSRSNNKRTTPIIDSNSVQSYTLDRKHLSDRKKKASTGLTYTSLDASTAAGHRRAPSLPEKDRREATSFSPSMRRYSSTKDVNSGYHSDLNGYRKGGLAAAFQERQDRASSLNRTIERSYHGSDFALASRFPPSRDPRPRSRSIYDSEPEVHYVPVKDLSSKSSVGRSLSILSSKRKPEKNSIGSSKDKIPGVHFASMSKEYSTHPSGEEIRNDKKGEKKDLKRSQSIPKDTKFPWLNRFRIKSKAREP